MVDTTPNFLRILTNCYRDTIGLNARVEKIQSDKRVCRYFDVVQYASLSFPEKIDNNCTLVKKLTKENLKQKEMECDISKDKTRSSSSSLSEFLNWTVHTDTTGLTAARYHLEGQ